MRLALAERPQASSWQISRSPGATSSPGAQDSACKRPQELLHMCSHALGASQATASFLMAGCGVQ
eukprot:13973728-Alexandrium_andersonii.AAC.1